MGQRKNSYGETGASASQLEKIKHAEETLNLTVEPLDVIKDAYGAEVNRIVGLVMERATSEREGLPDITMGILDQIVNKAVDTSHWLHNSCRCHLVLASSPSSTKGLEHVRFGGSPQVFQMIQSAARWAILLDIFGRVGVEVRKQIKVGL